MFYVFIKRKPLYTSTSVNHRRPQETAGIYCYAVYGIRYAGIYCYLYFSVLPISAGHLLQAGMRSILVSASLHSLSPLILHGTLCEGER